MVKNINYIAEISLPSKSAYSINVMKMCNAFSKYNIKTNLYVYKCIGKNKIFQKYNCKNKFNIISLKIHNNNFFGRILFAIKLFSLFKNSKNSILYSRSIIAAIFLSFSNRNIILEIHHELKGFTKYLFSISQKFKFFKNIKFVFISKNLSNQFNLKNKKIILDDGVDLYDFMKLKKIKKIKKRCVYTGSFTKGKGIETILNLSKLTKNIKYDLYGDIANSEFTKEHINKFKNVYYRGYADYNKIPKILNKYNLYLMPYAKEVYVRSNNIEVGSYMSPLKLFEYMASSGVLMASKMLVYKHILNKNNSILVKNNSPKEWKIKIEKFFNNKNKYNYLSKNSYKIVKNYTWNLRVKKIFKFINV